ncbi:unnamed protein product [Arabidopsis lyrata]|uniref:uncharacterized protein LOC9315592 n=1 Tax=Arabidopsis lyrata subsp. lyrata TaxID=81972 RepID=UPI000A29D1B1|nr:uncharacterized protein LOC9315592 [Arabidopsis lyrata subsp. lyrata]CAH8264762.1 unnamed protein product [Arabidopsis lyrata]|eukprot:XP_020885623.1 uncharacterized protein LOC9315592 [Arabidopsis lyrata subsp. lyrata]
MASLRPSFGSILRDRNQRHNDDVVFKKAQVKTAPPAISDESSQNRVDSLIGNKRKKNNKSRLGSPEKPRTRKVNNFSDSDKQLKRNDNVGGASSLVQIWEARLNRSNGGNSPIHGQSIEISSEASVQEIHILAPSIDGESESENESKSPDLTVEIESETLNSVSDSGESKCGRVADIIHRLSNEQKLTASNNGGAADIPIVKTPTQEKSSFPVVTCSPRFRGRQAYSDLLVHLERERHRELELLLGRNAVSRFPQRGRLQSMLRLRSLKRGLAIQDRHRGTTKGDSNRFQPSSTILHLSEKFRENAANTDAEAKQKKGQQYTVETESMGSKEMTFTIDTPSTERLSPQNRNIEEAILRKNETKMNYLQLNKAIVAEVLKRKSDNTSPITSVTHQEPRILGKEQANKVESSTQRTQETPFLETQETSFQSGWEEQEEYEDEQSYYGDMSYDWFTEISRPRTYWEDLRKSRYLEVMNTKSDKGDICRLLERRTVSDFLQSGLREKIDKLIMARVQIHPAHRIPQACKEEEKYDISEEEEKCDIGEEKDEDRDDLSQSSSQIFAPSPAGSWSSQDTGVTSTPTHNLHSNEMEIIGELRSHILQLQLEMSELRDSVKTCLDVNASLQKSVQRENPLKRKCCVCNETQVETLLYRCGHMCTCLRCANELQYNGGKCPICHAKILDVVRVFVDSRT